MGDRANIVIETPDATGQTRPIFVYSHWDGLSGFAHKLQSAIRLRVCWDDPSYLIRVIIDQVCKSGRDNPAGYGVDLLQPDSDYPFVLVVDTTAQRVRLRELRGSDSLYSVANPVIKGCDWSFPEFCDLESVKSDVTRAYKRWYNS